MKHPPSKHPTCHLFATESTVSAKLSKKSLKMAPKVSPPASYLGTQELFVGSIFGCLKIVYTLENSKKA